MSTAEPQSPGSAVLAAGGVLWRADSRGTLEIALIHRPRYDDWSLPKGKLDPDETAAGAAVREISEETGYSARLGRYLGRVCYPIAAQRDKIVDYWAARETGGAFVPNDEVDEIRWLAADKAHAQLTHTVDRTVLEGFRNTFAESPGDAALLLVRHAKAGRRRDFRGDDAARPLDSRGRRQAQLLVGQLLAFGAESDIGAADRVRCTQTVQPLAEHSGVDVRPEPAFSEEEYARDHSKADKRIRRLARCAAETGEIAVLCSQSRVIPALLHRWSQRDGLVLPPAKNRKASTWVLFVQGGKLVHADHIDRPST